MAARLILLGACIISALIPVWKPALAQLNADAVFIQGNEAFEAGDYERAISLYASILEAGAEDASILNNLASAYYRTGNLARALLYYRRAERYAPRDPDLIYNLMLARSGRGDLMGDETGFFEGLTAVFNRLLTIEEQLAFTWIIWTVWCGVAAYRVVVKRHQHVVRLMLIGVSCLLLAAVLALGNRWLMDSLRPEVVVQRSAVPAHSGPGLQYPRLFILSAAAEARIMHRQAEWVRLRLPDGRQGWVEAAAVEAINSFP